MHYIWIWSKCVYFPELLPETTLVVSCVSSRLSMWFTGSSWTCWLHIIFCMKSSCREFEISCKPALHAQQRSHKQTPKQKATFIFESIFYFTDVRQRSKHCLQLRKGIASSFRTCLTLSWKTKTNLDKGLLLFAWVLNLKANSTKPQKDPREREIPPTDHPIWLIAESVQKENRQRRRGNKSRRNLPSPSERPTLIQSINHEQTNSMLCLLVIVTLDRT